MTTENSNFDEKAKRGTLGVRRELWFGLFLVGAILVGLIVALPSPAQWTNGHLGLLMLALVVVTIMLGFPTAFTLMGMGVIFTWLAFDRDIGKTLDLMVHRTYGVMTNDVLVAIPLFVFMGYLVERANLIERLFRTLHVAMAGVPGALAVAAIVTCAIFATATGIVGAVVTLMGLLAMPAMLRAGYSEKLAAGTITAGGCLGILIPPSVMLIVYGATASVSVVQLYAGAFLPGLMLAGLYVAYIMILAKVRPDLAPPLPLSEREVVLTDAAKSFARDGSENPIIALFKRRAWTAANANSNRGSRRYAVIVLLPLITSLLVLTLIYDLSTRPALETTSPSRSAIETVEVDDATLGGAQRLGSATQPLQSRPSEDTARLAENSKRQNTPNWFWVLTLGVFAALTAYYSFLKHSRVEVLRQLLGSFFPLCILILAVLGSIVFGFATPTEAAAIGALGGFLLTIAYRQLTFGIVKESVFLTTKTSAMVCWLFVGSAIFSAAFALLGGQELVERWVLSLSLTPTQFLILSQLIIFLLGWPLEWTEIIVIFMPIFLPLLQHFGVDPLFFGLLVALNIQTAFLSPPVAMAAFYLKGVAPPHVTLSAIFVGMLPFMAIQIVALVLLYLFPQIGLWLPHVLYRQ